MRKLLLALLASLPAVSSLAESVELTIDPDALRLIEGVGELDRVTFFGLCDAGRGFDRRIDSPERMAYLLGDLNITFGRQLGPVQSVTHWNPIVREDADRPGYADIAHLRSEVDPETPSRAFYALTDGRLDIAAHGSHNAFPAFMGRVSTPDAEKAKKPQAMPGNLDAAAELSAAVMAECYTDFDRPRFYEPVNEPHWSFTGDPHLADWHVRTKAAVRAQTPDVLVGGPCLPVAYFYKRDYRAFNGLREFIHNTDCDLDFYSFHVYDYVNWDGEDLRGRVTAGLPLEGVLDLVQNHTVNTYGKTVDLVISEHGGYITGSNGIGADQLGDLLAAEYFPDGQGFEHTMRKRSISSHVLVSSVIANTLVFMDHPHVVKKAVPFILLESMNWDPEYYSTLYTPYNFTDKSNWIESRNIDFYKFFRDFKGQRVAIEGGDPDIQARALVDDRRLRIVLNNLSDKPETVHMNLPPRPRKIEIRRYGRNPDFTPSLTESKVDAVDSIELAGREAVLITATYAKPFSPTRAIEESVHYGDAIAIKPDGRTPSRFEIEIPDHENAAYATLRIGVTRPADADPDIDVTINGVAVDVPLEDAAPRLVAEEYASTKIIPIDPALLRQNNTVLVGFPDEQGGAIGSAVIRIGTERDL